MSDLPEPLVDTDGTAGLLLELVDHLDAMLAYWDDQQICRFANRAYRDWFGRGREELLGVKLKDLLGPLYEKNLPYIEAAYRGERQVFERAIPRPDGSGIRHSLATYIPRIVDGQVRGMFVHVVDVDPLKRLELALKAAKEEAEKRATHDELTGLPNRTLLRDRIDEAIMRARRTGVKAYLLGIDVDNFKAVNDGYGHPEGDRFLVSMAGRIKSCLRDYDTVARVGGDEFLVLAVGLNDGVEVLAERLLAAARQPYRVGEDVLMPSLSIGVAEFPRHGATPESLILAADQALYRAKKAGRNCFIAAESAG